MELPLLRRKKHISLEMIDIQNDNFGQDLELVITELCNKITSGQYRSNDDIEDSHEVRDLGNMIFERLGLKTTFICNSALAAILPLYLNKNHIFLHEFLRGNFTIPSQQKIVRDANGRKGTVNTHSAKLGGIFSEYSNELYMNFKELVKTVKATPAEIVAIMLHELGHGFYACEYSNRLETNNQILQAVAQEINTKKSKADRSYIFKELSIVNPKTTQAEVDELVDGNEIVAGVRWFRTIIGSVKEQMNNSVYSQTSFEALADNFASRFKYGRPLMTGLDKIHRTFGSDETSGGLRTFLLLCETISFVLLAAATVIMIGINLPYMLFFGIIAFLTLRVKGEDYKDYTYDELDIRYKRTRHQLIEQLKNVKLSSESSKHAIESIEILDKLISKTVTFKGPLDVLANLIFSDARAAKASVQEQQVLEELANNDFFLMSAKLRTL